MLASHNRRPINCADRLGVNRLHVLCASWVQVQARKVSHLCQWQHQEGDNSKQHLTWYVTFVNSSYHSLPFRQQSDSENSVNLHCVASVYRTLLVASFCFLIFCLPSTHSLSLGLSRLSSNPGKSMSSLEIMGRQFTQENGTVLSVSRVGGSRQGRTRGCTQVTEND